MRPHFLGPIGGLKIEGPLYDILVPRSWLSRQPRIVGSRSPVRSLHITCSWRLLTWVVSDRREVRFDQCLSKPRTSRHCGITWTSSTASPRTTVSLKFKFSEYKLSTVEPVLKDYPHWPLRYGFSRQVVFGDKFTSIEMWEILPEICGPSRQVISHGSCLSREVSLYSIRWYTKFSVL